MVGELGGDFVVGEGRGHIGHGHASVAVRTSARSVATRASGALRAGRWVESGSVAAGRPILGRGLAGCGRGTAPAAECLRPELLGSWMPVGGSTGVSAMPNEALPIADLDVAWGHAEAYRSVLGVRLSAYPTP